MRQFLLKSSNRIPNPGKTAGFVLLVACLSIVYVSCSDDDNPETSLPPVFSETPVDIAYDPSDSSYGDIVFIDPVITPFGAPMGNDQFSTGMEYFTVISAPVRAVTEGIVDTIIENPIDGDFEVRVIPIPGSDYTVIYDHIQEISVLDASRVVPGDTLGMAAIINDSTGRTLLRISLGEGNGRRFYCPVNFGDSAFKALHNNLLQEYNRRNFEPHYDSLCLESVLSP